MNGRTAKRLRRQAVMENPGNFGELKRVPVKTGEGATVLGDTLKWDGAQRRYRDLKKRHGRK